MSRNKTRTFPIVLKSIIDDAHKSNPSFTLNDKQIRSRLRARFADSHVKNTSWIATNSREYDAIRSTFDSAYAAKIAKPARKRRTKTSAPANADAE